MESKMTPAVERLVRLMVLLPGHHHPLWGSLVADRGDGDDDWVEVTAMRWFVGDAARMWPPAGPANLAEAVLTTFGAASENTLRLLSDTVLSGSGWGPQTGAAWVTQASAAAIDVLAHSRTLDDVLQDVQERWTIRT